MRARCETLRRITDCERRLPAASHLLPFRSDGETEIGELAAYLAGLSELIEVSVVDGSSTPAFERHAEQFGNAIRHLGPDPDLSYAMGKVNGVITGVRHATNEAVVIADDDIRYESCALRDVVDRLRAAELVVPQNYFQPLPWHARWDTARTLINRLFTGDRWFPVGDFPGTLGVRREFFLEIGAYDGDLIFENLELMRTVRAAGGQVDTALDLYVRRLPPTTHQFLSQRVRQAYDDFAIPAAADGIPIDRADPGVTAAPGARPTCGGLRHRRRRPGRGRSPSREWTVRVSGQ